VPKTISGGTEIFPECNYWESFSYYSKYGSVEQFTIAKGDPLCFKGDALISSKGDYTLTNAMYDFDNKKFVKGNSVKKGLAVLGARIDGTLTYNGIFIVETESTSRIKINLMKIPFSYYYTYDMSESGKNFKTTIGLKSIVSTKKSGEIEVGIVANSKVDNSGSGTVSSYYIEGVASYHTKRAVSVTIPDNYEIIIDTDSDYDTYSKSGTLSESKRIHGALASIGDFQTQVNGNSATVKAICNLKFGDSAEHGKVATDITEDDWSFPEISATLSTKGGIFTEENIDTTFPAEETPEDDGLSAGAIAAIVISCIVAVAAISFCVYWFVFRKKSEKVEGNE
jgi:hypothetical protein